MGISFDMVMLIIFAAFIIFAAMARIDFDIALAFAYILAWAFVVISPGSVLLIYLIPLLTLGLGLRILVGFIRIFTH
jgi:hypothetical protein